MGGEGGRVCIHLICHGLRDADKASVFLEPLAILYLVPVLPMARKTLQEEKQGA